MTLSIFLLLSVVVSYRQWIIHHQLLSLVNRLKDAIEYARNSAMTLQTTTAFCPKNGDWQRGQRIVDEQTLDELREFPPMPSHYQLSWRSTLGESTNLRFRSNGFTRGQQGSFFINDRDQPTMSAQLIILRTGRLRVVMHDQ